MSFSYNRPLLSITIPVYNMEEYLDRCLYSVTHQDVNDVEIIIVNDGSTDDSKEIIKKYAKNDKRIKVIEQKNSGLIAARERAVHCARGKYIAFLDPDDWIEFNYYKEIIEFMIEYKLDIGIGLFRLSYDGYEKFVFDNHEKMLLKKREALAEMLAFNNFRWELWDKVYKTSIIKEINLDRNITCGEDLLRNWYAFGRANSVGVIPLYGYHYYQRQNSMTKKKDWVYKNTVSAVFAILNNESMKYGEVVKKFFDKRMNYFLIHDMYRLQRSGSNVVCNKEIDDMKSCICKRLKNIILSDLSYKTKLLAIWLTL